VSFSCSDGRHICDGTPIADVAKLFHDHPSVVAIGINCTPPQFAPSLIAELKGASNNLHILAYPNSGETYNAEDNSWSGTVTPRDCAAAANEWVAAGAKVIGGCCRMGPAHISAIASSINLSFGESQQQ
jgi:homocysteine S-methyltransferase